MDLDSNPALSLGLWEPEHITYLPRRCWLPSRRACQVSATPGLERRQVKPAWMNQSPAGVAVALVGTSSKGCVNSHLFIYSFIYSFLQQMYAGGSSRRLGSTDSCLWGLIPPTLLRKAPPPGSLPSTLKLAWSASPGVPQHSGDTGELLEEGASPGHWGSPGSCTTPGPEKSGGAGRMHGRQHLGLAGSILILPSGPTVPKATDLAPSRC